MSPALSDTEDYDDISVSSVLTSDVSSVSDIGSPPRKGVRRVLRAGEKLRAAFEDFANDVHEAYTFDLNPEYRLKIVKKFDGLSIGARFDFPSGDCRIKAKRAPSATPGGGSRFWRWFKGGGAARGWGCRGVHQTARVGHAHAAGHRRVQGTQQKYELQVQDYFQAVGEHARHVAAASGRVGAIARAARFDGTST